MSLGKTIRKWRRRNEIAELNRLIPAGTSIISSNCFGGRICQDLKRPYNSPTAGLFFILEDFIEFCTHLRHYLTEASLTFTATSKWPEINERRSREGLNYPIGVLDGTIEIPFLHYAEEAEAREKWHRRAARVDFDNVMIFGLELFRVTEADFEAFERIPFTHKYLFVREIHGNGRSQIQVPESRGKESVGDGIRHTRAFYKALLPRLRQQ